MIVLASAPRTERGAGRVPVPGVGTRSAVPPQLPERHGWPFLSRGAGPRSAVEPDPPAAAPAVPAFSRAPAPVRHVP